VKEGEIKEMETAKPSDALTGTAAASYSIHALDTVASFLESCKKVGDI